MTNTDTETQTPVEASNAAAALPGSTGTGPAPSSPAGGAMAASGSSTYAVQTSPVTVTPTAGSWPVNASGQPYDPFRAQRADARTKDDEVAVEEEPAQSSRYVSPITGIVARGAGNVFTANRSGGARNHSGVDMSAANGTPVNAMIGGTVVYAGKNQGYGWNAVVLGDDGHAFRYATHGPLSVKAGQRIEQGAEIGVIGQGHLHFEVIRGGSNLYKQVQGGGFVSTSWMRGTPRPDGLEDPLEFFGIGGNLRVAGGKAFGTVTPMVGDQPVTATAFAAEPRPRPDTTQGAFGARGASQAAATLPLSAVSLNEAINGRGAIIERGWNGAAVTELQNFLNMRGVTDFSDQPLLVDGNFGRRTREAVKRYQVLSDIEVDGRVGPETFQSILFDIDPRASIAPGSEAYDIGRKSAAAIVAPTEVDIRLPPARPERGAGIPNPRLRPKPEDLTEDEIDELTRVDEAGNYIAAPGRRLPTEGLVSEPGKMTETRRAEAYANLEWASRMRAAQAAAAAATRQRIEDRRFVPDKFRPVAKDSRAQSDIMLIRSTEAVREFARGLGDTYRRVTARQQTAVPGGALSAEESRALIDIAMRSDPTPAETVTETYGFWPAGNPIDVETGKRGAARRRELATRELQRELGKLPSSTTPPTGNVNY